MRELEIIKEIERRRSSRGQSPLFGDDCATIASHSAGSLVTTDMLMDGVHFDAQFMDYAQIGRKAVATSLSDIASSGGWPRHVFLSLALPRRCRSFDTLRMLDGVFAICDEFQCDLAGGDTNIWNGPLVINVTVIGEPHHRGVINRANARPGDIVMVTGALGGSLNSGRHLCFTPRVHEARWIMDHLPPHAMIDVSDGIATDLRHLATASGVDIELDARQVPIHPDVPNVGAHDALIHALTDGEDFELLFCVSPIDAEVMMAQWPWSIGISTIGRVKEGAGTVWLIGEDQQRSVLALRGFEHR